MKHRLKSLTVAFCALLLLAASTLSGCASLNLDSLTGECASATVVGAGAGGLAAVLVGDAVLKDASKGVRIGAAVGTALVGAYFANRACARANAQKHELEMQFAAVQSELDSLRSTQDSTSLAPSPPKVEVVQVQNEESHQTEAVMTKVELGEAVLTFDTSSDQLPPTAPLYLRPLARALAGDENQQVLVVGHTDNVGAPGVNLSLSERRAQAVANFLGAQGISQDKMQAIGAGEHKPIAPNDTPQHRAQNRRVEVYIIHQV